MGNAVELKAPAEAPVAKVVGARGIPRQLGNKPAPLSFAQEQIWLHAQLVPESPIYNEPVTIRREGTLDVPTLERALTEIVQRHESWRTRFALLDGEPVQIVDPASPVRITRADLSHIPLAQRESEAQRLAIEDSLRPFDLSRGPLFRMLLISLSDSDHRLFLTLHHIIFDGYSVYRILLPELATLYAAFAVGQKSPLPPLPIQYADFAQWEREWLSENSRLSSQLAYWRKQLGGDLPVLRLPYDHSRPAVQSFRGAIQPVAFSREASDALKLLSRREGVSLFMTLVAAFAVLLQRYSSMEDVVIGTVSSGRKRSELEGLLGYFLNPVVLRNDLSGDPTFRELLRRTRNMTLDALSNDDAPFTQVVNDLHPSRNLSFNPLFQVLLTLEPPLPKSVEGWTVALTQSEVDPGISKFDLCLELDDHASGIAGRFKYTSDLLEADTVARMAGHLVMLLQGITENPDLRISQLPLLTKSEHETICVDWNDTAAEFPADLCLHQMVESQAERIPQDTAVISGDTELTYRQLELRSNQLAAHLRRLGVGPEQPVGLFLEPSPEMIVGILGVLKAGGVCVPLDPSYPADRVKYVLNDTRLRVLLTQEHLRTALPESDAEIVALDSDWSRIEQEQESRVDSQCTPDSLAYLIYTSGSTGKPKGVQITHRNLVHSTYARSIYYGRDAGRFLLLSSFSFDSSLVGIFGALCRGGSLVLTPGLLQKNLSGLAGLVAKHQVSELLCVPSLYSLLLEQAKPGELASLLVAIVAGESCPAELVEHHYKQLPHATLYNEYGPTEAAVWSAVYRCEPGNAGNLVPIGRPVPNMRLYVLDSHLNPVPVGVLGELCIGGPGVARGYLNRPEETSERFIPDPFSAEPKARLYKSGDLVRFRTDGNLEMLGRLDHQIKIRGFRIEVEEIEAVIADSNQVRNAVVALQTENVSTPMLVAYVVPVESGKFEEAGLRRFLIGKLPDSMVPGAFVVMRDLPLTPNGKVDRNVLPLFQSGPVPFQKAVPSHTALEASLVKIWESVLGRQGIGVTDNFFDLGGHSLLVAKLLLRIEQQLGRRISLADVFQAPTIRQLAVFLGDGLESKHHPAVVPIQPQGSKPPLIWIRGGPLFRPLANRLGPDQPTLALHLPGPDANRLPVPYRFEDVAASLVKNLREIQPQGPYYLAGLCVNAVIAYEMASILKREGQEVALLMMIDGQNPAYYQDFSQSESRGTVIARKLKFHWDKMLEGGPANVPRFLAGRLAGVGLRLSVLRWRLHHKMGWKISQRQLENDLDTIVHPTSYFYRPGPYPGHIVFFQSSDWPACRYFDFYASWDGLVEDGLAVHRIPGGHQSMFHEKNVDVIATQLKKEMEAAADKVRQPGIVGRSKRA